VEIILPSHGPKADEDPHAQADEGPGDVESGFWFSATQYSVIDIDCIVDSNGGAHPAHAAQADVAHNRGEVLFFVVGQFPDSVFREATSHERWDGTLIR